MSQESNAQKFVEDFGSTVQEMLDNARAIKGERFADVVGVLFNLHQLVEIIAMMSAHSTLEDDYKEFVANTAVKLISSAASFSLDTIESEDVAKEAFEMANRLEERRHSLNTDLNK